MVCIYKDDLYPYLVHLREADFLLIATPIYFDTVSSQTKLFIDRCNCFRPPKFENGKCVFDNDGILNSRGAYILVGGAREKYDAAKRVIHGLFIWAGIENVGNVTYAHEEDPVGAVTNNREKLAEVFEFGARCAKQIE
jgi:multimeric flavodoxin WrbA